MKIDKAEQALQLQLMTQVFKQAVGDSSAFQIMMESLTKAMEDSNSELSGLFFGEQDLSKLGVGGGEKLLKAKSEVKEEINLGNTSIEEAVEKASRKYGVDKEFIKAVIKAESSFDPKAKSHAGAMGLMQLMPGTAKDLGVSNPYDIEENVEGGTKYLRGLLDMYGNSKELALAAYNAGPGTVKTRGVQDKEDIERMPSETRNYVKNVMKYYGK